MEVCSRGSGLTDKMRARRKKKRVLKAVTAPFTVVEQATSVDDGAIRSVSPTQCGA